LSVTGGLIDWESFDLDYTRQRIPLPTYPFQRKSWLTDKNKEKGGKALDIRAFDLL
jgi:acyl transferase domain-containing protein